MTLLLKALIWRVLGTSVSFIVTYAMTGRLDIAATVGAGEFLSKMALYYAYEKLWARYTKPIVVGTLTAERV